MWSVIIFGTSFTYHVFMTSCLNQKVQILCDKVVILFTLAEDYKNFNYDDTQTTNLYLGNINPKVGPSLTQYTSLI